MNGGRSASGLLVAVKRPRGGRHIAHSFRGSSMNFENGTDSLELGSRSPRIGTLLLQDFRGFRMMQSSGRMIVCGLRSTSMSGRRVATKRSLIDFSAKLPNLRPSLAKSSAGNGSTGEERAASRHIDQAV